MNKPGNPGFGSIDEETGDGRSDRKRRKMQSTADDPHLLESEQALLFPQNPSPNTDPIIMQATLNPGLGLHQHWYPASINSGTGTMMIGPPPQLATSYAAGLDRRGSPPSQHQQDLLGSTQQQQQQQLMALQNQSSLPVGVSNNNTIGNALMAQDERGGADGGLSPHYLLGEHSMAEVQHHNSGTDGSPDPPQQLQLLAFQAQQLLHQTAATQPSLMMAHGWNFPSPGFLPHQPGAGSNILNAPTFVPGEANNAPAIILNPDAFVISGGDRAAVLFGAGRGPNSIDFEVTSPSGDGDGDGDVREGNVLIAAGRVPASVVTTLFMRCDTESLSEYQCLMRMQIEMFEAGPVDLESNTKGRNKPIMFGQVGIRCRHCSKLPPRERTKGATYFPAKLNGVYQSAQGLAFGHLRTHCKHIPSEIREQLFILRDKKSSAGGGKDYWAEGVRIHGVFEDEYGLRYKKERKKVSK